MKILIVSKYDKDGGAALAAYRLHKSLLSAGMNSQMVVQKKMADDFTVIGAVSLKQKLLEAVSYYIDQLPAYFYKNRSPYLFSPAWFSSGDILKQIKILDPDIVHIHWSCKGMLSVKDIGKIKAPIVFTMHDSWLFTGGCHIPWECKNYRTKCGRCPTLASSSIRDLSSNGFNRKIKLFSKKRNITLVAVSKWLQTCAMASAVFDGKEVLSLPNAIMTEEFKPIDKAVAKKVLNLNNKKYILFGALSATSDLNKGYKELFEALNQLSLDNVEIIIFGSNRPEKELFSQYKVHYMGRLNDVLSLRVLYSAADVMVVPSLMEAFGQTASESMSCGTPVVAFDTSGLRDIVDHKENGYLAEAFETADLANGIEWVLSSQRYDDLSLNARQKVLRNFDGKVVAEAYRTIYQNIMLESDPKSEKLTLQ
jgi:glycosyltransferase involved in cell wall biosynthesis